MEADVGSDDMVYNDVINSGSGKTWASVCDEDACGPYTEEVYVKVTARKSYDIKWEAYEPWCTLKISYSQTINNKTPNIIDL